MAETPDDFHPRFRAHIEEYKALVTTECTAEKATSTRVVTWIDSYLKVLEELKGREQAGKPVPLDYATLSVMCGLKGYTLLDRATWLEPAARARLAALDEQFPHFIQRGPYRFTADFGQHHLPQWRKDWGELMGKPGVHAIEVGVHEGVTTAWLLDNVLTDPSSRLVCIDPFLPPRPEDNYTYARRANAPSPEQLFDANVAAAPGGAKVTKRKGFSGVELRALPVDQFDLAYIDGSHLAPDVLEDAVLVWRLLRVGGIVTFDDYGWVLPTDPLQRPRPAVDAFMSINAGKFELLHQGWQVTLRKVSA